jgi:hypothetical protein
MEPTRRAPHTKALLALAAGLVLTLLSPAPAQAELRTFRAVDKGCGIATFRLSQLVPAEIESAYVHASGRQRSIPVSSLRTAVRRGLYRARLPRRPRGTAQAGYARLCALQSTRQRALRWAAEAQQSGGAVHGHGNRHWRKRARFWLVLIRRQRRELPSRQPPRRTVLLVVELKEASSGDPVIAAAGDIASEEGEHDATSNVLLDLRLSGVLTLGDNTYPDGLLSEFTLYYAPTWGRLKDITHPSPGNHDYGSGNADGYFDYFGAAAGPRGKGFYSYDLGDWHLISLNSNVEREAGSEQEQWLRADLAAHSARCTLAYWHHPRFSSGNHGGDRSVQAFWNALHAAGADVVLNGHDHSYERFAPQDPGGARSPNGIREFVVGTGGKSLRGFSNVQPNSEVRSGDSFGVLALTLHPRGYEWRFVPAGSGSFTDSGSDACH